MVNMERTDVVAVGTAEPIKLPNAVLLPLGKFFAPERSWKLGAKSNCVIQRFTESGWQPRQLGLSFICWVHRNTSLIRAITLAQFISSPSFPALGGNRKGSRIRNLELLLGSEV